MKHTITTLLTLACAACLTSVAAETTPSVKQLQSFQKNLARQHLGSNLFLFDSSKQTYIPTEAAAAWLDDDISTGWPALAGKQHYVLQFSEPQVLTNFSLSTAPVEGTITIYSGDEVKNPGDVSWQIVAKDVPVSAINQKKLAKSFNRQAKCILIETNIPNPGPIFSLYAYGERVAVNDAIVKRSNQVEVSALGEFVNNQTSFNVSSIYSQGLVTYLNGGTSSVAWQKAIDDNPETSSVLKASTDSGMVITFGSSRTVSRLALLTDVATKGKADVYLLAEAPAVGQPVSLDGVQPSVTISFDGSNARASVDFDDTTSVAMAIRWTPETAGQSLNVRELNTFANLSLADYEVDGALVAIAEAPAEVASEQKTATAKDGKEITPIGEGRDTADYKGGDGKGSKEIIGEAPPEAQASYFPGGLGFPPNLSSFRGRSPVILVPPGRVLPPDKKFPSP